MKRLFYRFEPFLLLFIALSYGYYLYQSREMPVSVVLQKKSSNSQLFFDEEISSLLQTTADSAKQTLDVVSFTCSEGAVIDSLRRAALRGVKVRLICGKESKLLQGKIDYFLRSPQTGILHEKFMVQDGTTVVISTGNIANIRHNNTAIVFRKSPQLVTILQEEMNALIKSDFSRKCVEGCTFEEGVVYFSSGACRAIGREIRKAKKSLRVALYTVTDHNPLYTALISVIKRKIPVTLVVDDWNGGDEIVNKNVCLRAGYHGAEALYDNRFENNINMLLHDKIAVIDTETTIVGSMNWTASACYRNRELVVKLDDPVVAEEVEKHIMEMAQRGKACVQ